MYVCLYVCVCVCMHTFRSNLIKAPSMPIFVQQEKIHTHIHTYIHTENEQPDQGAFYANSCATGENTRTGMPFVYMHTCIHAYMHT